jgi:4-amino-4-deoxy-L-arabinose transferase-like glycosyltransferase
MFVSWPLGYIVLLICAYTGFLAWVRSRVRRGRSKAWGIRLVTSLLLPIVIVISNSTSHAKLPFTGVISTFGRPHAKDVLTAERALELFQEYNDTIVQTIQATDEIQYDLNLRMMILGMAIVVTFGVAFDILCDPPSALPPQPTDDRA